MSFKKYIGVIVGILTLLGIVNQQQVDVHNQEIVLEFNTTNVSQADTDVAISILKEELQYIGVERFKVVENSDGKLKITYYSDKEVASVKRILLEKIKYGIDASKDKGIPYDFPFEDNDVAYHLDVHEIQHGYKADTGLNGIEVIELKPKAGQFFKPKLVASVLYAHHEKARVSFKVAFSLHKNTLYALNNALQQIPEVRAGPHC